LNQDPETLADGPQDGKDRLSKKGENKNDPKISQEIGCSHSHLIVRAIVDCQFFILDPSNFFLFAFLSLDFIFFQFHHVVLTWFCFMKSVLICMLLHARCRVKYPGVIVFSM